MAFQSRDLSVLAYANGFTLWHYRTNDRMEAMLGAAPGQPSGFGYFDSACELLRAGDRVMVNVAEAGRAAILDLVVTAVGADGRVGVSPIGGGETPLPATRSAA